MRTIAEKLDNFTSDIMADVTKKRQEILQGVDAAIQEEYDKKETEYYTLAYERIQDGLKKIDKEKNEIMSKAVMENKIRQLNKRNEILDMVFSEVRLELKRFTKSPEYKTYLKNLIEKDMLMIGEGEIIITLNQTDEALLESVEKEFHQTVQLESKYMDFIGGCKLMNKTTSMFIDDSFEKRLLSQRDVFLQKCRLMVE